MLFYLAIFGNLLFGNPTWVECGTASDPWRTGIRPSSTAYGNQLEALKTMLYLGPEAGDRYPPPKGKQLDFVSMDWYSKMKIAGQGGGREIQEKGDMSIPMADSCWCMVETNTTNTQYCKAFVWCSVMSDSLRPYGLQPAVLCPWNFPGRILEWVIISYSRGSSQPRDWTPVSCTAGRF